MACSSTSALLDLHGVHGSARQAVEAETIRDQRPMDDASLRTMPVCAGASSRG